MGIRKQRLLATTVLSGLLTLATLFPQGAFAELVKKSNSGLCHDQHSSYFERTKRFTEFGSLAACLDSGGRLPKNYSGPGARAGTSALQAMEDAQSEGRLFTKVYDRDDYNHWIDRDGDCQDERHELLQDSSQVPVTFSNARRCYVDTGRWYGPYTNEIYNSASQLHVDHIVSLKYAHIRGAHSFSPSKKEVFANDRDNLIVVEAGANMSKSARGPTEWLPPSRSYQCTFLAKFDRVMKKYALEYKAAEKRTVQRMQAACNKAN
jgi:hypothetical protein